MGDKERNTKLLDWLNSLPRGVQDNLANEMETSVGQLRQIAYGNRKCSARLAVAIDKFSGGVVSMVDLAPEIDWNHVSLFIHARKR